MNSFTSILLLTALSGSFVYLISNIMLQIRAKTKLEKSLLRHEKEIEQTFVRIYFDVDGSSNIDSKYEALVTILRKEIDSLNDATDKVVLKKTLDRKNFDNQKRFAFKIFSDTGILDRLFNSSRLKKELV